MRAYRAAVFVHASVFTVIVGARRTFRAKHAPNIRLKVHTARAFGIADATCAGHKMSAVRTAVRVVARRTVWIGNAAVKVAVIMHTRRTKRPVNAAATRFIMRAGRTGRTGHAAMPVFIMSAIRTGFVR
jgi:hypothetical protein